jgi:hypothetical protein
MDDDKINLQKTLFAMWLIAHLTHKLHVAEVVRKNLDYVG